MDTRQTGDPAVRNLERRIRFEIEKLLLITTIVCLGLEIALATYYYLIRDLGQPLNTYIEFRILLPCGINVILYLFTRFSNRSENSTDSTKNRICSIALLLITGVISLAHSYFIPLWMLPLFVVMFCSVFQDDFIQKVLAGFSFVIILYSGILHLYDYPTERTFTIICIVIAEVMAVAISFTSFKMETYIVRMFLIAARGSATGGNGAKTDRVTGVYSKSFLISEAEKMLSEAKELEPCGFAVTMYSARWVRSLRLILMMRPSSEDTAARSSSLFSRTGSRKNTSKCWNRCGKNLPKRNILLPKRALR